MEKKKADVDVVRAWKDPAYYKSLTPLDIASLPPHPAGNNEVMKEELVKMVRSWVQFLGCNSYTDNVTYWSCHCDLTLRE